MIWDNSNLRSLRGLESLKSVGSTGTLSYRGLEIQSNPQLTELVTFNPELSAYINIHNNDSLTSLAGMDYVIQLDDVILDINNNPNLLDFSTLSSLKSIGGLL